MNLDYSKVKELLLVFAKLDDEYRDRVLSEAYKLSLMQGTKDRLKKDNVQFKNEKDFQDEVVKKTNETAEHIIDIMKKMDKLDDTQKASIFMLAQQLAGKSDYIQEPEISITIGSKNISMKEYLEKHLMMADYDEARKNVKKFMDENMQDSK